MVKSYREKRLAQGVTARTVNKETVAFYQVLSACEFCFLQTPIAPCLHIALG